MKRTKAIIAAALISSALFTTSCGKLQEVDPFDPAYFSYEVSGISGYTGKISLPRSKVVTPETFQENFTPTFQCDYTEPLANGDTIKIMIAQSEDYLKETGYKATRTEMDVTISGLEELPETLPDEVANSIMDALKEATLSENEEYVYSIGDEIDNWRTARVLSVGEPQLVKGLYEVTSDTNAADSPFKNEEDADTDYNIHPPKASFKALWSITYEAEYLEDAFLDTGKVKAGDIFTKTDLFYASIDGFTVKDGKAHYNQSADPYCSYYNDMEDRDYTEYVTGFESLSDKEHFAKVEY